MDTQTWIKIFQQSINDFHKNDSVDQIIENPFPADAPEHLFYVKNWVDTVQWHLEDIVRNPEIEPSEALKLKRLIDASNQKRTDLVEFIDAWFLDQFKNVKPNADATLNTETPAWALDRLSILELKIFHMAVEVNRENATVDHRNACNQKLDILLMQRVDLENAIQQLIKDIQSGRKYMKLYKQMKMYNDESLNPILYSKK